MYIIHTAAADPDSSVATKRLNDDELTNGDDVTFHSETGKAQVTQTIGEQLCNHFDDIVPADEADGDLE